MAAYLLREKEIAMARGTMMDGRLMRWAWYSNYQRERLIRRHYRAATTPEDLAAFTLSLLRPGGPIRRRRC